jgi:hypothetical protein
VSARRIPERFQVSCEFCDDELDMRAPGVHVRTVGWVKNRKEGGGNAVHLAERLPMYACSHCIERQSLGQAQYQASLF